ncbi:MAG: zinc-ribbon domain-containing protein [Bacteroidia bacterium]
MKETLNITHPKLCEEWHKDNIILPNQVTHGSHKKILWQCQKDIKHNWLASIGNRALSKTGCPFCANKKVNNDNSLLTLNPDLMKEWDFSKNILNPNEVTPGSNYKSWWICSKNIKHNWEAIICSRTALGNGCPYCVGHKADDFNNLAVKFPQIAKQWHSTKNGNKLPENYTFGSHEKIWWICDKNDKHEWYSSINQRTSNFGCPYCANLKTNETNNLKLLYPKLAKEWNYNKNILLPDEVNAYNSKKYWWICLKNNKHTWLASVSNRKCKGCPYCSGHKVNETNCLATMFPDIANEWHPEKNGNKTPENTYYAHKSKVWWRCNKNNLHEWQTVVAARTKRKYNCPFHSHIISKKEILWLDSINIELKHRHKTLIINNKKYQVDAYVEETNTIYEFYGDFWHGNPKIYNPEKNNYKNKKKFKELYYKTIKRENEITKAGYKIITIWENEFEKANKLKKI